MWLEFCVLKNKKWFIKIGPTKTIKMHENRAKRQIQWIQWIKDKMFRILIYLWHSTSNRYKVFLLFCAFVSFLLFSISQMMNIFVDSFIRLFIYFYSRLQGERSLFSLLEVMVLFLSHPLWGRLDLLYSPSCGEAVIVGLAKLHYVNVLSILLNEWIYWYSLSRMRSSVVLLIWLNEWSCSNFRQ